MLHRKQASHVALLLGALGGLLLAHRSATAAPRGAPGRGAVHRTTSAPAPHRAPPGGVVIKGQVALTSFPTPPTAIQVAIRGHAVAEAPLSGEGRFSLTVPAGQGYQLELVTGGLTYTLVFPRGGPQFDTTFNVANAKTPFDIGLVQYVSEPKPEAFVVTHWDPLEDKEAVPCAWGRICVDDIAGGEDVCGSPSADETVAGDAPSAGLPPTGKSAAAERNLPPTLGCPAP
jgi:hypothetical protein